MYFKCFVHLKMWKTYYRSGKDQFRKASRDCVVFLIKKHAVKHDLTKWMVSQYISLPWHHPISTPLTTTAGKGNNPNCQQLCLGPQVKHTRWNYCRSHIQVGRGRWWLFNKVDYVVFWFVYSVYSSLTASSGLFHAAITRIVQFKSLKQFVW